MVSGRRERTKMTKYYFEAYRDDHTPILGNGDGQSVIEAKDFRRTNIYKHLKGLKDCGYPFWRIPAYWRVVDVNGKIFEKIDNIFDRKISQWKF
jgi:hypothetical protein